MKETTKKKSKSSPLSSAPYLRRDEGEIRLIVNEIQSGMIGLRAACFKYGLNRNTLKLWITRLSIRNLEHEVSNKMLTHMSDDQRTRALNKKIHELTKALDYAKLKILGLETMIKVSEEEFHIKIRKKPGTKRSKE